MIEPSRKTRSRSSRFGLQATAKQGKEQAGGDGTNEDIGPSASPARARVVGDVAHQRVGEGVGEPWQRAEQAHECRAHAEAEIQHDDHAAARGCKQVVHETAQAVDQLVRRGDAVFGGGLVVLRAQRPSLGTLEDANVVDQHLGRKDRIIRPTGPTVAPDRKIQEHEELVIEDPVAARATSALLTMLVNFSRSTTECDATWIPLHGKT